MIRATVAPAAIALLAIAGRISAQEPVTRGFTIGVHAGAASLSADDAPRNDARGVGLRVGYGVSRRITILAQSDAARFEDQRSGGVEGAWTMAYFDVGVRFNFVGPRRRWVPFLQASAGGRTVRVSDPVVGGQPRDLVEMSGPSLTFGGGFDVYLSPHFAIDAQLLVTDGELTTLRVDRVPARDFRVGARSTRIDVGAAWWL